VKVAGQNVKLDMILAAIDELIRPVSSTRAIPGRLYRKLRGMLFSILIAAIPVLIVAWSPPDLGGTFVAGYLVGAITAPLIVIAGLKAADDLFESGLLRSSIGTVLYFVVIILISLGSIAWSFYFR